MKYNRFLPILVVISALALLETYYFRPKMLYVIAVLGQFLFFFVIRQFILASHRKEKWYLYLILPGLFFVGDIIFSATIPNRFYIQILIAVNVVFLYLYFRTIYFYLVDIRRYQPRSMENISAYGNFLAFYFIASSIYGLQVFLGIEIWKLILALMIMLAMAVIQVFWINQIQFSRGFLFLLIIELIITELSWSISFLTLNYYILGLILAVCYYIIIGLTRFYLLGTLTRQTVRAYLVFGFSSIILVLLTANWLSYG